MADNAISSFTLYNQAWCAGPPTPAYPLEVYTDPDYGGSFCYSWQSETANIFASCNDLISSVLLRSGWSARVYGDQNQSGSRGCLTSSDSNLTDNTFFDGSSMNDAISSFNWPRTYRDYSAEIWKSDNSWSQTMAWQVSNSWTLPSLANGTYYWHVQSGDGAAGSGWSPNWSFTVNSDGTNASPNVPIQTAPANTSKLNSRNVSLVWQDAGDPDNAPRNYRDFYAEIWKSDNSWKQVMPWQVTNSWNVIVPSDGIYFWHVQSGDGAVGSAWSSNWSVTIQTAPPSNSLNVPYVDQVYVQQPPIWGSCPGNPRCFNYWNHCGPASVAMILSYENKETRDVYTDRQATLDLVNQVKRAGQGGSDWGLMLATLKAKGLQVEKKYAPSFEEIKRSIQNGHPVLMGIGQADHILVVVGFEGTNTVIVNDPYGAKLWWNDTSGKLTNAFRNGKWVPEPAAPQNKGKAVKYTYGPNQELSGVNAIFISGSAPAPHATTAQIGSAGGTLVGDGGRVSFTPTALSTQAAGAELTITHTLRLTAAHTTDGLGYPLSVLQLDATSMDGKPVQQYSGSFTLTVSLDPAVVNGLNIESGSIIADGTTLTATNGNELLPSWNIFLAYWDQTKQQWIPIPSAKNPITYEISAQSKQFTEYAVIAQPRWHVQLPLVQH